MCLALHPIKCHRHPDCGGYDTSLIYARHPHCGGYDTSLIYASQHPPLKILRTYDEWSRLGRGNRPSCMFSCVKLMTQSEYDECKKEKKRVAEEAETQAMKLRNERIQIKDFKYNSCVDLDGVEVKYVDHLKIAKKVLKSMKTKVSDPLLTDFDKAFLAAIKESK